MMRKIGWAFLYLYVLGFAGYGVFELKLLQGVTFHGILTEYQNRQMPWETKAVDEKPAQMPEATKENSAEIPFANLDNVG